MNRDVWSRVLSFVTPNEWHSLFHAHETFREFVLFHEYVIVLRHRSYIHDEDWDQFEKHRRLPRHVACFVFDFDFSNDPRLTIAEKETLQKVKSPYEPNYVGACWWTAEHPGKLGAVDLTPRIVSSQHGVWIENNEFGVAVMGPHTNAPCAVHGVVCGRTMFWTPAARKATKSLFNHT